MVYQPFTTLIYEAVDVVPDNRRFIGHTFAIDKKDALQMIPATQFGPTAQAVREKLDRFLEVEVARAAKRK